jgi:UDP-glucuronate decarboxylase
LVVSLTGFDKIEYRPLPSDDPTRRRPDISVATELLGWAPRTHLRVGFLNTLNDFARRTGHYLPFRVSDTGQAA